MSNGLRLLRRGTRHVFVIAAAIVGMTVYGTPGQPGTLDSTWASTSPLGAGKVRTPVGNGASTASIVLIQPDSKVVLGGFCGNSSQYDFCALRYEANGNVDPTFGDAGKVITNVAGRSNFPYAATLQPDGKLILAGQCSDGTVSYICALRYNSNGTLDASFGNDGTGKIVGSAGAKQRSVLALGLQSDRKLVLVGECFENGNRFCAMRYHANGTLDASFGTNGGVMFEPIGSTGDFVRAVVVQPDDKLVLVGYCYIFGKPNFCALRINADGSVDTSFGARGKVAPVPAQEEDNMPLAVTLQPDGKLILTGTCFSNASNAINGFCAVRYGVDGNIDVTFGDNGKIVTAMTSRLYQLNNAYSAALQPDGKLLLTGSCLSTFSTMDFCALRYHANGVVDRSFGIDGVTVFPLGANDDIAMASALQVDGKLLLAGSCSESGVENFCAARLDGGPFGYKNCSLDIDGDNRVLATTDSLIHTRIALGITGSAVTNGITFPAAATRNTWPLIRDYLVTQCGMSLVQ